MAGNIKPDKGRVSRKKPSIRTLLTYSVVSLVLLGIIAATFIVAYLFS